jgi:hypothetical protein
VYKTRSLAGLYPFQQKFFKNQRLIAMLELQKMPNKLSAYVKMDKVQLSNCLKIH